ncbi:hypothetical protein N431DRAFT_36147 [Stipitochalara longipes BDJ]|nr:hypothetical protein N431DRAFT_36147 [Stipitochalara longipes BDJ]
MLTPTSSGIATLSMLHATRTERRRLRQRAFHPVLRLVITVEIIISAPLSQTPRRRRVYSSTRMAFVPHHRPLASNEHLLECLENIKEEVELNVLLWVLGHDTVDKNEKKQSSQKSQEGASVELWKI